MPKNHDLFLGYEWNPDTGEIGKPVTFDLSSHFTVMGPTRCGKDATLGIPNTLKHLHRYSLIDLDTTGQGAAVCGPACTAAGMKFMPLNPMGLHVKRGYPYLESLGCNVMLAGIDPNSPRFYEEAAAIADSFDWGDTGKGDPFFTNAGRDYTNSLIMHVRRRDGDNANLSTVLQLMMEGEETDKDGKPTKGPRYTAAEMVATGHFQIAALAGRFLSNASPKTIDGIRQTAQTAARSLLSDPVRDDLSKNGIDWNRLTETPCYVPVILPADDIEFHRVWVRLILSCALNVIYRKAGDAKVTTVLRLPEFFAIGPLRAVQAAMGQAAKYGVRVWPVLQDIGQLQTMFGDKGAQTFIANSGCFFAFTPGDDNTAEFLSRYAGEHVVPYPRISEDPFTGQPRHDVELRVERRWPAHKIRSMPKFHGLVWKFGSSVPQPVYCPPYWEDDQCRRVAKPDPFHPTLPPKTKRPRRKLLARALAASICIIAAGAVITASDWLHPLPIAIPQQTVPASPIVQPSPAAAPVSHHHRAAGAGERRHY